MSRAASALSMSMSGRVNLADGAVQDEALREAIRDRIRTRASPRHVPDEIVQVPAAPHTRTGQKLEIPVKRLLQGSPIEQVVNPDAVDNPQLLAHYSEPAEQRHLLFEANAATPFPRLTRRS